MVFFVSVAADVYGRKQNVRLEFPTCPTISELINASENQYDITARATRPAGYPDIPFRVQTFQVYDDILLRWVDLYSSAQLTNGCQVYSFQPETVWNVDLQGTIPIARDSVAITATAGSPRRIAAAAGVLPSMSEKLRAVFYELDSGAKGYILYSDLRSAFLRYDIAAGRPVIVPTTEELISARRARQAELDRLYRESEIAAQRASAQREYDLAKQEAELARARAAASAARERDALNKLYYTPASPRRFV